MTNWTYPPDIWSTAPFVLYQADPNIEQGKVLTPGSNITITIASGTVTVSAVVVSLTQTFITRNNETATLPNSFRIIQGSNMNIVYGVNTVTFSSTASGGGSGSSIVVKDYSSDTSLTDSGIVMVSVDASGGQVTLTLPDVAMYSGTIYFIKKRDTSNNRVIISRGGSDLIDGANTFTLYSAYQAIVVYSNSQTWSLH